MELAVKRLWVYWRHVQSTKVLQLNSYQHLRTLLGVDLGGISAAMLRCQTAVHWNVRSRIEVLLFIVKITGTSYDQARRRHRNLLVSTLTCAYRKHMTRGFSRDTFKQKNDLRIGSSC